MAELDVKQRQAGDVTILDCSGSVRMGDGAISLRNAIRGLNEQGSKVKSMSLFVLKNNPAFRFYRQHGFDVVQETSTKFVMRRAMAEAAYGN